MPPFPRLEVFDEETREGIPVDMWRAIGSS